MDVTRESSGERIRFQYRRYLYDRHNQARSPRRMLLIITALAQFSVAIFR